MVENAAIVMLIEMGVLDVLVAKQGIAATAAELAAATGCSELLISMYYPTKYKITRSKLIFYIKRDLCASRAL